MKLQQLLGLCILLTFAFVSCQPKEDIEVEKVRCSSTVANALSVRIVGEFIDLTQKELAYGTTGVLYMVHSDNSKSVFNSWEKNENVDCNVFKGGKIGQNFSVEVFLTGLTPSTSYDYCLFFESEKGERFISNAGTMTTKDFAPEFSKLEFASVRYFDAQAICNVKWVTEDLEQCVVGMAVSDDSNITIDDNVNNSRWDKDSSSSFSAVLKNLKSDRKYYVAPFLYVKSTDSYVWGEASEFRTRNLDEMAVDLGLSVKWADCNFGAQSKDEKGECYAWGMLKSNHRGTLEYYEYYKDNQFIDIGPVISGNDKYDIVTATFGGKWRMPTIEEVIELYENCSPKYIGFDESDTGISYWRFERNGNSIDIVDRNIRYTDISPNSLICRMWTGTVDKSNPAKAHVFLVHQSYREFTFDRKDEYCIRPVMDY